jgi:hypothetical protein
MVTDVDRIVQEVLEDGFGIRYERISRRELRERFAAFVFDIADKFGPRNLPLPSQTAAVSDLHPKLAALFYDRVWSGLAYDTPAEIAFFGGSEFEIRLLASVHVASAIGNTVVAPHVAENYYFRQLSDFFEMIGHGPQVDASISERFSRAVAESLRRDDGVDAIPQFASRRSQSLAYSEGTYDVVVAALSQVPVIAEETLTWEQVVELRADAQCRRALRRFVHWLDKDMVGRSPTFIADEISERMEDYQRAVRKHGLRTVLGALSSIIDSKVLLGGGAAVASISYASNAIGGLIAGGAVLAASAAIHVSRALIDLDETRYGLHPEIAFVAEVEARTA